MYSANESAKMTGLSTATLRYYEKEHLLPPIERTSQGYRQYTDTDIEWITMIQCLRSANVPIQNIKIYIELLLQGGKTIPERSHVVTQYRELLTEQLINIQCALSLTNEKLDFYGGLLQNQASQNLSYIEEWNLFKKRGEL